MDEMQKKIWNTLCSMSGEEVARVFTDFYGDQLLDENFKKALVDEGYMEDEE